MAQMVKNPPAMLETWIQSLGWENPLKKGVATHSSILAWRIPWREESGGLQSMGSQSQTRLSDSLSQKEGNRIPERLSNLLKGPVSMSDSKTHDSVIPNEGRGGRLS